MSWSNENKSCMRVDKSWQARVCIRVFSTLMSWSNENKSYMRVDKREFVWEFSQLSCPGKTRTRVTWELVRVDKREFVWEFSQHLPSIFCSLEYRVSWLGGWRLRWRACMNWRHLTRRRAQCFILACARWRLPGICVWCGLRIPSGRSEVKRLRWRS